MNSLEQRASFEIEKIETGRIPEEAMEKFEGLSAMYVLQEEYIPGNFEGFWKAQLRNGVCYITKQRKLKDTEHSLYIFQFDHQGNPLGYAHVGELEEECRPFTWLYFIRAIQLQKGYAKEMLPFLGSLSEYFFRKPLNSTKTFIPQIDPTTGIETQVIGKLYERFEKDGLVTRLNDGTFIFVKDKIGEILHKNPLS